MGEPLSMALGEYSEKREFGKTPEPAGGKEAGAEPLKFVVQKHDATRLHYDVRLEMQGVLKSWAVPKGPPTNPKDKRLAVMVEDHPIDYAEFEGVIPEGNYGAGPVMIWDKGYYAARTTADRDEAERLLVQGLEKGHLTFILNGEKLKGEYALVKLRRAEENAWLLIKADDEFASEEDVAKNDRSAASGRSMEEICEGGEAPEKGLEAFDLSSAPTSPTPRNVRPMLATLVDEPFDRPRWLYEIKWDGYRTVAEIENGRVRLYSRNLLSLDERFAEVRESLKALEHDCVLDGEVVVVDEQGVPRFGWLQNYPREHKGQLVYYVFDLLYLDGHDLRPLPLEQRKEILQSLVHGLPHVSYSDHVVEQGTALYNMAEKRGLEGVVAKDPESPYREGIRGREWLKVKTRQTQLAVVAGFTEPRGGRKYFGALVLGAYRDGELEYIGHTGSGFDEAKLVEAYNTLKPLEREASPFATKTVTNAPAHWVEPKLVCEVLFSEWTEDGKLRAPVFAGFREDVSPSEVRRERPEQKEPQEQVTETKANREDNVQETIGGRRLSLTNQNKVYWPDEGYTKGDLVAYYRDISQFILPYLRDRPESLHRFPNGITGQSFYQKDAGEHFADWIQTISIQHESEDRTVDYMLCQDEATLVYMANLGCIEVNPWNSRVGSLDKPNYIVLDLDPEDIGFDKVVEAALAVREVLDSVGAPSYPKTSGATGIHIYVPLAARYGYDTARQMAELVAYLAHRKTVSFTSVERSPSKRQKKVYIDFLQNRRGQTLAAPYSVRPMPGATVSAPLKWEEVTPRLRPQDFTMKDMAKRLEKVGDIFNPVLAAGVDVEACLQRLLGEAEQARAA